VLSSSWATLLGLPTSLWGFLAYASLAGIAFVKRADRHWQYAWLVSFFGFLFSLYLTTVSITILHAACPYCLTSLALMTATFAYVTVQRPDLQGFSWGGWLIKSAPVAAAILLVLHLNFTGILGPADAPENPIARALADHLTQRGAKFYGAQWCPHCKEQKAVFGSAAKRLPYIECSPDGYGTPEAEVCKAASIESYPTWVIDGKRYEQVMSLTELENATGFKPPAAPPESSR
jgi:glutaredoxin